MLTKNTIRYIRSLADKKNRDEHLTFVVEGNKMILELIGSIKCQYLIATKEILSEIKNERIENIIEVKEEEIKKVSFLKNPQQSLAVFYQPAHTNLDSMHNKLTLVLDEIQDPGNLGTIVRIADWYGIENIICSHNTADIYNPKTVQATMGALAHVKIHYTNLTTFLEKQKDIPIYGTFLDGDNIYEKELSKNGLIVMGNEGKGVSKDVEECVNERLLIPSYPTNTETSESLNVAIATAIICAEFRRRVL